MHIFVYIKLHLTVRFNVVICQLNVAAQSGPDLDFNFGSDRYVVSGSVWGADMSGPQRQFSGEPTCRSPNADMLGSRQVCSRTPDSRPVGSPTTICWGADRSAPERQIADLSVPQRRYAGEPTCLGYNGRRCSIGCSGSDCLYIALRVRSQLTAAFICGAQK